MKNAIPIDQCAFYRCRNKKRLAKLLNCTTSDLKSAGHFSHYKTKREPKRDGGFRTIYMPDADLKQIQNRIKKLLERIEKPEWVFSAVKGVCHVDNAFVHKGNSFFVQSDICSFYDSCKRSYVYMFFRNKMQCAPDIAEILAGLTTLNLPNANGSIIPTGSPCSQLVAFFSYFNMFNEINNLAHNYGCVFSLYVDDLTMSSKLPICNPKNLIKMTNKILKAYGHSLKSSKTEYRGAEMTKIITGVALCQNGLVRVPNRLGNAIITDFDLFISDLLADTAPILGRINASRQIVPGAFPEIEHLLTAS